ncbi:MAG: Holliday junction resolvase RuvX [Brevinema sp.]
MARILALDYGLKRIGVALSDETRMIASAYPALLNNSSLMNEIQNYVNSYNVDAFLLGKPMHEGENSFLPRVLGFAEGLHRRFSFPIYLYDESLSSVGAKNFLVGVGKRGKKLKESLDSAAAQSFLAEFLLQLEKGVFECYTPKGEQQ